MRTPREKLIIKVIGCDGSHWTISGGAEHGAGKQGVWLDKAHVGMITDAPVETVWESSATQVGATYRDTTYLPRDITVPVGILDSPERSWQLVDSRWRMAWSTARDSTIVVIDPATGSRREVKARLYRTPEPFMIDDLSGQQKGSSGLAMYLRSGDPLYSSLEETDVWRFNGINYVGSVLVSNPADVAMPPQWVMKGPAGFILPDFSFEDREGWPGYEHRDRRIVMPHQPIGTDVIVDLTDGQEQVAALGKPNYWQLMNGQFFMHKVPPWTPPTRVPVVVNPLPWLPGLWHRFGIPFELPAEALVAMAVRLTERLEPLGEDTVLSWTPERLAQEINTAMRQVLPGFIGEWVEIVLRVLTAKTIGEIIAEAWGSVANMAGAGVQLRQQRKWTRPYGLEM